MGKQRVRMRNVSDNQTGQKASSLTMKRLPLEKTLRQDASLFGCKQDGCNQEPAEETDKEEEEWVTRKMLTGAVCRTAFYRAGGQEPIEDILGLRRTRTGRLKVSALQQGGTAAASGVDIGDQLVSINGRGPCESLMAEAVRMHLRAPAVIIFMGFVGKLQAEVRVRQPDSVTCGFHPNTDVSTALLSDRIAPVATVSLCDPVIFEQAPTSLFLAVSALPHKSTDCSQDIRSIGELAPVGSTETECRRAQNAANGTAEVLGDPASKVATSYCTEGAHGPCVYELQRQDARRLVCRALRAKSVGV